MPQKQTTVQYNSIKLITPRQAAINSPFPTIMFNDRQKISNHRQNKKGYVAGILNLNHVMGRNVMSKVIRLVFSFTFFF